VSYGALRGRTKNCGGGRSCGRSRTSALDIRHTLVVDTAALAIKRPPAQGLSDVIGHFHTTSRDRERALCRLDNSPGEMRMLKYAHAVLIAVSAVTVRASVDVRAE
jgi:hypothetical protein